MDAHAENPSERYVVILVDLWHYLHWNNKFMHMNPHISLHLGNNCYMNKEYKLN